MCGIRVLQSISAALLLMMSHSLVSAPLRVMTYRDAPFAEELNGRQYGLLIELLDALFKQANISYTVEFLPLKRGMIMAEQYKDVCVLPVERSQEREAHFSWISPVLLSRYGLFSASMKSLPLTTLKDAKALRIGSFLGSGTGEYLGDLGFNVELTTSSEQNLKKLEKGRIDLWAAELVSAQNAMKLGNVQLGEPELVFYTSMRAMACHPELPSSTKKALEGALNALYQSGFIEQLNAKYGVKPES